MSGVLFQSESEFNLYCQNAISCWRVSQDLSSLGESERLVEHSTSFVDELKLIENGGPDVIPTPWGGVTIKKHLPPLVEKYLVVRSGKYLNFEKHEEKIETLEVIEGYGELVYRPLQSTSLLPTRVSPGFKITLEPGQEHCLIAFTNLLVFESSLDHKGMDNDLIFIYEAAA